MPQKGFDFVRLGNIVDNSRQGTVYMTADDSGAPFIAIKDGVTSHTLFNSFSTEKARLGRLTGIYSPTFGQLEDYGLWTNQAYFEGNVRVAGTLTAGDENGVGSTFYAGRIKRNFLKDSQNFASSS